MDAIVDKIIEVIKALNNMYDNTGVIIKSDEYIRLGGSIPFGVVEKVRHRKQVGYYAEYKDENNKWNYAFKYQGKYQVVKSFTPKDIDDGDTEKWILWDIIKTF
jgi:hypothetical protein